MSHLILLGQVQQIPCDKNFSNLFDLRLSLRLDMGWTSWLNGNCMIFPENSLDCFGMHN